jgi:hypothetical protein
MRLQPDPKTNIYNRIPFFYFHNSTKGYSHGCIEVTNALYDDIINYRNQGVTSIPVIVEYPDNNSSTYGETDK